ncbi:inverse autotransporter beta domain-containing protein [Enterobacter sp. 22452]|uniref:inverse autotransporter beta domain-containing protein n=1 Tax=Enterobacter TaxID=547 RepID=UPI003F872AF8
MFGGNVFFDDDFIGDNRHIGLGMKAWTSYLKLATNIYTGTTNWHSPLILPIIMEKASRWVRYPGRGLPAILSPVRNPGNVREIPW